MTLAELPAPLQPMLPSAPEDAAARTWLAFGALDVWQRAGFVAPAATQLAPDCSTEFGTEPTATTTTATYAAVTNSASPP